MQTLITKTPAQLPPAADAPPGTLMIIQQPDDGPVESIDLARLFTALTGVNVVAMAIADLSLAFQDGTLAFVYGPGAPALPGYYVKNGAPGVGNWSWAARAQFIGPPGGNIMSIGAKVASDGQLFKLGANLFQTSSYAAGSIRGAALYIVDPAVSQPDTALNLLAYPDDLTVSYWDDSLTTAARARTAGGKTLLTDSDNTVTQEVIKGLSTSPGLTHTGVYVVEKDMVPAAIRLFKGRLDDYIGSGGQLPGYDPEFHHYGFTLNTQTGAVAVPSDCLAPVELACADDGQGNWRVSLTMTTGANANILRVSLDPAVAADPAASAAVTGSTTIAYVRLVRGTRADAERTYAQNNPRTTITGIDENGAARGMALAKDQLITPFKIGCLGDGKSDDTQPFQAFCDYITGRRCDYVDWSGNFRIASAKLGPDTGRIPTGAIMGDLNVQGIGAGDVLFTLQGLGRATLGRLTASGAGGELFSTRTYRTAIRIAGESGRAKFEWLKGNAARHSGVFLDGNSGRNLNFIELGLVQGFYCGSGAGADNNIGSVQTSWTKTGTAGTTDSITQRSVVDVGTMYPAEMDALPDPTQIRINGFNYVVTAVIARNNDGTGTVQVYPRLRSTDTEDTDAGNAVGRWIFGAMLLVAGNNCNSVGATTIDANYSGRGICLQGLFGAELGKVQLSYNGTAIAVGRSSTGISRGNAIANTYFENGANDTEVEKLSLYATLDLGVVQSPSYGAWKDSSLWRLGDDTLKGGDAFRGISWIDQGVRLDWQKMSGPAYAATTKNLPLLGQTVSFHGDALTFSIQAVTADMERITGRTGACVRVFGSGASAVPSGNMTFQPPAGATLNGGSGNVVLTGAKSYDFECIDTAAQAYVVRAS